MSINLVSAFESIMHCIRPIPNEKAQELYRVFVEDSMDDFINELCYEDCICKEFATFLKLDIYRYEYDENGSYTNYYEVDYDKQVRLLEVAFGGNIEEYAKNYKEQEQ